MAPRRTHKDLPIAAPNPLGAKCLSRRGFGLGAGVAGSCALFENSSKESGLVPFGCNSASLDLSHQAGGGGVRWQHGGGRKMVALSPHLHPR